MEGAFSQPNGRMCEKMLTWARDVTRNSTDHDLLELYCGNGNFTVALASNFRLAAVYFYVTALWQRPYFYKDKVKVCCKAHVLRG